MSEPVAPRANLRMVDQLARHRVGYTDHDLARVEAAEVTRRLIRELSDTTAPSDAIREVTRLIGEAADLLAGHAHGRDYFGSSEGSLVGGSDLTFVDFSPFVGPMSPLAPPIEVQVFHDRVEGLVEYALAYEGPPGHVHGGFIAAGFDEMLGFVQGFSGQAGMTGRLEISYRSPTPLHRPVRYTAGLTSVSGRKVLCWGTLHDGDRLCAEATALFITFRPERMAGLLAQRAEGGTEPAPEARRGDGSVDESDQPPAG